MKENGKQAVEEHAASSTLEDEKRRGDHDGAGSSAEATHWTDIRNIAAEEMQEVICGAQGNPATI